MDERVDTADVDKRAEIGQAAHCAGHGFAFLDFRVPALFEGALLFFGDRTAIDHHVLVRHVQLDDAAANFLADQFLHFARVFGAAARSRHKGAHTDVDRDAAFHGPRHHTQNGSLVGKRFLECGPVFWPLDSQAGQFVIAFRIAAFDGNRNLVANLHRFSGALKGSPGNDAFGLEADVYHHRFRGHLNDRAF